MEQQSDKEDSAGEVIEKVAEIIESKQTGKN